MPPKSKGDRVTAVAPWSASGRSESAPPLPESSSPNQSSESAVQVQVQEEASGWARLTPRRARSSPRAAPSGAGSKRGPAIERPFRKARASVASTGMDATGQERKHWLLALTLGVLVGGGLLAFLVNDQKPPIPPPAPRVSLTQPSGIVPATMAPPVLAHTTVDTEGRATRIGGGDPSSVLTAYCEAAQPSDLREPIGIREAPSPQRGVRLGVFRRVASGREYAIWIRMDPRTGKWSVGNGQTPVTVQEAPASHR